MDALTIHRDQYGQPADVIRLEEVPVPHLNPEDATRVLVAVLASGPNFNTNFAALGLPVPPFGRGDSDTLHVPGSDALGIVVDAGPAVRNLKVGQAVILDSWTDETLIRGYETHDGFNAQFAVVDQTRAIPVPAELSAQSPERLAAMLLTYGTAYRAVVERLAVGPGDSVLLMGGGKGTSFAGAQIAKALGARVILMGSNPELGRSLIERGIADAFVDRRRIPQEVYGVVPPEESYESWMKRTDPFRSGGVSGERGKADRQDLRAHRRDQLPAARLGPGGERVPGFLRRHRQRPERRVQGDIFLRGAPVRHGCPLGVDEAEAVDFQERVGAGDFLRDRSSAGQTGAGLGGGRVRAGIRPSRPGPQRRADRHRLPEKGGAGDRGTGQTRARPGRHHRPRPVRSVARTCPTR